MDTETVPVTVEHNDVSDVSISLCEIVVIW